MKRALFVIVILILTVQIASAQSVSVECNPSILYPNDVADCKLKITFPEKTYVSGISFISSGVDVIPNSVSGVGWVTSYELPFNVKAKDVGIHTLTVLVNTINGTVKQSFNVQVVNDPPEIVLNKTTLYLNEVNTVGYEVVTPFEISNVVVKPLFPANPQIVYGDKGVLKFIPSESPLKFEIHFYNGRNKHIVTQSVDVQLESSKGLILNVTPEYPTMLIGDVIPVHIEVTNLRTDDVYDLRIETNAVPSSLNIPLLKSGESKRFDVRFCSNRSGEVFVKVVGEYKDEFNNVYEVSSSSKLNVLNETTLQFSSIEVERNFVVTLSGDVSNNGRSKVYNIYIIAIADGVTKTYYIDSLEPSDFDSFEFTFDNASSIILKAKWNNELGYAFEIEKVINVPKNFAVKEKEEGNVIVPVIVLIAVIAIVVLSWWKYARRTGDKKSQED